MRYKGQWLFVTNRQVPRWPLEKASHYMFDFRRYDRILHETFQFDKNLTASLVLDLLCSAISSITLKVTTSTPEVLWSPPGTALGRHGFSSCSVVCVGVASSWTESSLWVLPGPRGGSKLRCVFSATTCPALRWNCPAGWTCIWNVPLEPTWQGWRHGEEFSFAWDKGILNPSSKPARYDPPHSTCKIMIFLIVYCFLH